MKQVNGRDLGDRAKSEVLAAFIYRWTVDNKQREQAYRNMPKPTMPLTTDDEWLASHWFWVTKDGRLARNRHFCTTVPEG